MAEGKYVSHLVGKQLAIQANADTHKQPHECLSNREYQVLSLIAAGKTRMEIAEELSLSVATIHTYRARVLKKRGLENNVELARYAIEHKLVP